MTVFILNGYIVIVNYKHFDKTQINVKFIHNKLEFINNHPRNELPFNFIDSVKMIMLIHTKYCDCAISTFLVISRL